MEPVIATVLVVGMIGGVGAWVILDARKRKAATVALAGPLAERSWSLATRGDQVVAGLSSVPFGSGAHRRCEDVIRSSDKSVVSFTYRWTTGSGEHKNNQARRVTMLVGSLKLPKLEVEADTVVSKTRKAAAGGDHDVELAEFTKAWSVRATDERVGHAVLHPAMVERFMKPDLMGRSVFFEKGRIGLVDHVVQLDDIVRHTDAAIATLREVDALIPDSLRAEFA